MASGFVSENDLEKARNQRQEEWDKVRQESDPKEAPEPEYDSRSLFERLEANREKKQLEWEEAHKLKNQIRGIDDEEADFLDKVSKNIENYEKRIENEELAEVQAYRLMQGRLSEKQEADRVKSEIQLTTPSSKTSPKKSAQSNLLKSIVKRPSTSNTTTTKALPSKVPKTDSSHPDTQFSSPPSKEPNEGGALLGIGDYGSSSSSEEEEEENDEK
eukprot:TRINITY_DN5614_c0_g1_i1.p1 TRINITY_DN5614_c0_g1~~TRINITY_DN5614_c0_g1_i1.p1  ORF type:complete len:216 (+),score=83.46 TRINITY_DN5614_c0_g1_i1:73-720(+)